MSNKPTYTINFTLPMLVLVGIVLLVVRPEPETIVNILTTVWVLYMMLFGFLWIVGKLVMRAVRKGIKDGTLKFTVEKTEEKGDDGSSNR